MSGAADFPPSKAGSLPLVGGLLALDLCNTASGRGTPGFVEHLREPEHLIAWCRHAGIVDGRDADHLADRLGSGAMEWDILRNAIALRDAIYRLDAALAAGEGPDQADVDAVATVHARHLAAGRLMAREGSFGWTWRVAEAPEAALLGPVAVSAMALLMQADRARLKQCEGHQCGWLFLDTTKSNNRRWCEMEVCGNRAKQRRRRGRDEAR